MLVKVDEGATTFNTTAPKLKEINTRSEESVFVFVDG
jgi:hypothetical protein